MPIHGVYRDDGDSRAADKQSAGRKPRGAVPRGAMHADKRGTRIDRR